MQDFSGRFWRADISGIHRRISTLPRQHFDELAAFILTELPDLSQEDRRTVIWRGGRRGTALVEVQIQLVCQTEADARRVGIPAHQRAQRESGIVVCGII